MAGEESFSVSWSEESFCVSWSEFLILNKQGDTGVHDSFIHRAYLLFKALKVMVTSQVPIEIQPRLPLVEGQSRLNFSSQFCDLGLVEEFISVV